MSEREIQYVEVAGKQIAAVLCVCPVCKTLVLNTDFVPGEDLKSLIAECPLGHSWRITKEQLEGA